MFVSMDLSEWSETFSEVEAKAIAKTYRVPEEIIKTIFDSEREMRQVKCESLKELARLPLERLAHNSPYRRTIIEISLRVLRSIFISHNDLELYKEIRYYFRSADLAPLKEFITTQGAFENLAQFAQNILPRRVSLTEVPLIHLSCKRGITEYIDYITPGDTQAPLMWGVDRYKRPFFVITCKTKNEGWISKTLFQRFPQDPFHWIEEDWVKERKVKELQTVWSRCSLVFFRGKTPEVTKVLTGEVVSSREFKLTSGDVLFNQKCWKGNNEPTDFQCAQQMQRIIKLAYRSWGIYW